MSLCILHISTRLIIGGSQENTVLSCEGQARDGHEVHLAFGPIEGPEGSMLGRVEEFNRAIGEEALGTRPEASGKSETRRVKPIGVHEVADLVREIDVVRDWRCLGELERLIEELQPDVVHTHSSKAGVLGRIAAWRVMNRRGDARPTVVHTVHGPPFMPIEGGAISRAKIRFKNWVYTLAERYAAKQCHAIVCVCEAMRDQFLARGIGRQDQYRVVYSGMEIEPFLDPREGEDRASVRTELGFDDGDYVIGTVARLAQHKGHDDVLDALAEPMRTDPAMKLLWVGDGYWGERLRSRVAEMGLDRRVVCTGMVDASRIPSLMRAMDVLVHPSYREGLPRTVPQALLAGTPVVATDVDGTREACIPGETGRLVPVGDAGALREAVLWMRNHPAEAKTLAERGREMCRERFGAAVMVEQLERVYREELG